MSLAGQKVIPATFKLVPIEGSEAVTNAPPPSVSFDQAGGHDNAIKTNGETLTKKVTDREASFYELAEEELWPQKLLPKFYGRVGDDTIQIENLTHGYSKPCVMDLKMGIQSFEDTEASFLKRLKMNALDYLTGSRQTGVRLEGLSMYRTLENARVKGTKAQSHSISAHIRVTLQDVLTFFLTDESGVRTDVALRFQRMVEEILVQFEKNRSHRFIGSSLLFIYDNDNRAPHMLWARALRKLHRLNPKAHLSEDQISGLTRHTKCDVRMIDFAHVTSMPFDMVKDDGYITGLHTIIDALKAIRVYREKPIFSVATAVVDLMEEKRALARQRTVNPNSQHTENFTFNTLLTELTPLAAAPTSPKAVSPSIPGKDIPADFPGPPSP